MTLRETGREDSTECGRGVRCLQIVEFTFREGAASLHELSGVTGVAPEIVQRDITSLRRGGLRIGANDGGLFQLEEPIPGFALRLTTPEAVAAWGRLHYWRRCHRFRDCPFSSETILSACSMLASGLRIHNPCSEERNAQPVGPLLRKMEEVGNPNVGERAEGLTGEARRIHRRLRIVDLAETDRVRSRDELAAALGVARRTVSGDLAVMRRAGLKIAFLPARRVFRLETLHTYLTEKLPSPEAAGPAAALLEIFEAPGGIEGVQPFCCCEESAARKITRSIRLIFRGREHELTMAPSVGK